MVIYKNMDAQADWLVYHKEVGNDKELTLNSTRCFASTSAVFNNTTPTSTVNTVQTNSGNNTNDANYVMYSFAEKLGSVSLVHIQETEMLMVHLFIRVSNQLGFY